MSPAGRSTAARAAAYTAAAAVLQFPLAWLCAAVELAAQPPTGTRRAPWVTTLRESDALIGRGGSDASSWEWRAYRRDGLLAGTRSVRWAQTSFGLEDGPGARPPAEIAVPNGFFGAGQRPLVSAWLAESGGPGPLAILEFNSFGVPFRALGFSMRTDYATEVQNGTRTFTPRFPVRAGVDASGLTPYTTPRPALVFPLAPLWPGFALNTLVWALILFACHPGTRMLRRSLRRRRGRCPRCAYDRRGLAPHAPCPECGERPSAPAPPLMIAPCADAAPNQP